MKVIELKNKENQKEVTLERARELLRNKSIADDELRKLMDNLRVFCRILIDIGQEQEKQNEESKLINLSEYKEAA
jgi:hypothetical protein